MSAPAMTFRVGDLMNPDRMVNGPIVVYWGLDEAVWTPSHIEEMGYPDPPKISWWGRRRGMRSWKFMLRLQPPADEDLGEWAGRAAAALGIAYEPSREDPTHTAVWIPGSCSALDPSEVIAKAVLVLESLQGFAIVAAQVEVEAYS